MDRRVSTLERLYAAQEQWSQERAEDIMKMDRALFELQAQMRDSLGYIKGAMRAMVVTGAMGAALVAVGLWIFNEKNGQLKDQGATLTALTDNVTRITAILGIVVETNQNQDKQLDYVIKHLPTERHR